MLNNERWPKLLALREELGPTYGSEDLSVVLYGLARQRRPERVLELGTGCGVTTSWIAHALSENGLGHIWTIDDGSQWPDHLEKRAFLFEQLAKRLENPNLAKPQSVAEFFPALTQDLDLQSHATLIMEHLDLSKGLVNPKWPFMDKPLDWVFSDVRHSPDDIYMILAQFLPLLAQAGSIFIDSAPTLLSSYLVLERLMDQLNSARVPDRLLDFCRDEHRETVLSLVQRRRFLLTHLVERKDRSQNSTAWINIEPLDYTPYPKTYVRY